MFKQPAHHLRAWGRLLMIDSGILVLGFLATMFAAWAGLVVGVAFLSTRAKFLAPSITLMVALDVGRHTFRVLSRTDMVLAVAASILCVVRPNPMIVLGLAAVWCVIVTERFWLLPVLDFRAGIHLVGLIPTPSYHHALFARLKIMKVLLLLICSAVALLRLAREIRGGL